MESRQNDIKLDTQKDLTKSMKWTRPNLRAVQEEKQKQIGELESRVFKRHTHAR